LGQSQTIIAIYLLVAALPAASGIIVYVLIRRGSCGYMVCATCTYPFAHMESMRCPECGNDVRQTGLLPIGRSVRRTAAIAAGLWMLLFLFLVFANMQTVLGWLPTLETQVVSATLGGGRSDAFTDVAITGTLTTYHPWLGQTPALTSFLWSANFSKNGKIVATLSVNEVANSATLSIGQQQTQFEGAPDTARLADKLKPMISPGWDQVLHDELATVLITAWQWRPWYAPANPPLPPTKLQVFSSRGGSAGGGSVVTVPGAVYAVFAAVFLIGLLGIALILYVGRQRIRALIASQFPAPGIESTQLKLK
jgi:hypothetical protein